MKYVFRTLFLGLLLFECANLFGILHYTLGYTWFGLVVTLLTVFLVIEIVDRFQRNKGHPGLHWNVWLCGFTAISIDFAGDIFNWYHEWAWYDQVAHLISSALLCLVLFQMIRARDWLHRLALASLSAISIDVLYEIEEYLEDWFTGSSRSGGSGDTANDLLLNTIGVLFVSLCIFVYYRFLKNLLSSR